MVCLLSVALSPPPPPQAQATAVQGQVIQASLSHEAYRHAGGEGG
jgi:hypothetical protein